MSCNNTPFGYPTANNDCCTDVVQYARFAYSSAQSAYANATEFNKVYLGSFATPPTVDNQGDPLQEGALYYNTASNEMRVWNGSAWVSLIDLGGDLTINTVRVGLGSGNIASNTVVGQSALSKNTTGYANCAFGGLALAYNTTGYDNVSIGNTALLGNTEGFGNVAIGSGALDSNTKAFGNIAIGMDALSSTSLVSGNIAIGYRAMENTTTGLSIGIGYRALYNNDTGSDNTALGYRTLDFNISGYKNTAVGHEALLNNTTGVQNTAVGSNALNKNTIGNNNVANGVDALANNTTGQSNTAVGTFALSGNTVFSNVGGFGYNAQVSSDNEIRLGDANISVVVSHVGSWSDERDKTDIRDTILGLEFINELRPVDYKWDYREDYRPEAPAFVSKPAELKEDASDEEKAKYAEELAAYNAYKVKNDKWLEDCKWSNLVHDGTHKRTRYHHGLIAQELKAVIDRTGIDFGGFQDHTINGGDAVMTIGYTELIAPMIKAIQELSAEVNSLKAQLQS